MRRAVAVAALLAAILSSCGTHDRPEGAVEDWLLSLNQGAAGRPNAIARREISSRIFAGWHRCDPGALEAVEVGRGFSAGGRTYVPYRVEFADDIDPGCRTVGRGSGPLHGVAVLMPRRGRWRIVGLQDAARARRVCRLRHDESCGTLLSVPSEGGWRGGSASAVAWLGAMGIAVLLIVGTTAVMRRMPRPAFTPSDIAASPDTTGE